MADGMMTCPHCKCPGQWAGLACGFCGDYVPDLGQIDDDRIIGYRAWLIRWPKINGVKVPRLHSVTMSNFRWEPGVLHVAKHGSDEACTHPHSIAARDEDPANVDEWAPVKNCCCGFYAAKSKAHLLQMHYHRYTEQNPVVVGEVQMLGKIITGTQGWKAQKARPIKVYVPYEHWRVASALRDEYGPHDVEIDCDNTLLLPKTGDSAIPWCQNCGAKMGRTPECPLCGYHHK